MSSRVGVENEGWSVANLLVRLARSNNTTSGLLRRTLRRATRSLQRLGEEEACSRLKLAALECELRVLESLEFSLISRWGSGEITPAESSMLKTLATELHQRIATAVVDIAGPAAACTLHSNLTCLEDGTFSMRE